MKRAVSCVLALLPLTLMLLTGCSQADRVSCNLSKEADNFNVVRQLTVINCLQGDVLFQMTGKLSILADTTDNQLEVVVENEGGTTTKLFMRGTPRYVAGSRFKYTPDYIDFNYKSLVKAIGDAIDKQMEEDGSEYFTTERNNLYLNTREELNFDALMEEFNSIIQSIMGTASEEEFANYWQPRIVQITDRYLGKGMKVSQCSREQTEALDLIVTDLHDLVKDAG